jgi:hypothetical protein
MTLTSWENQLQKTPLVGRYYFQNAVTGDASCSASPCHSPLFRYVLHRYTIQYMWHLHYSITPFTWYQYQPISCSIAQVQAIWHSNCFIRHSAATRCQFNFLLQTEGLAHHSTLAYSLNLWVTYLLRLLSSIRPTDNPVPQLQQSTQMNFSSFVDLKCNYWQRR